MSDKRTATATRVFVVEDELLIAEGITHKLKSMGYAVAGMAASGEDAIASIKQACPDVVLMDIKLAGEMSGIETAAQVRALYDVPVIYLTALSDEATLLNSKITEPFGYIFKPFKDRELRANIEMALYKHEQERRLKTSEERYRVISEMISDFAYSYDLQPDGKIVIDWITDSFTRITGYSTKQNNRRSWLEIVHPDDQSDLAEHLKVVLEGNPNTITLRIIAKDGQTRWLRVQDRPVWDEAQQRVAHIYGAAQDVTNSVLAEKALRESEARLNAVTTALPDLVFVYDHYGKYVKILARQDELLYMEISKMAGRLLHEVLPELVADLLLDAIHQTIASGETQTVEYWLDVPAGRCWFEGRMSPLQTEPGQVEKIILIARDVTERKLAEEAMRESEQRFRSTFEQAAVGLGHTALNGRFLRVNQRFCQITGYSEAEMLSRSFQDITHPDDLECDLVNIDKLRAGEIDGYKNEKRYIRKDGSTIWINLTVSLARDESTEPKYMIGVIEDITNRKQAEAVLNIQHQLDTTLNSATGLGQALKLLLEIALSLEDIDCGGVYLVDPRNHSLDLVAHKGLPEQLILETSHYDAGSPKAQVAMEGNPIFLNYTDLASETKNEARQKADLHSMAILPICHEGNTIALLNLASHIQDEIHPNTQALLETIAARAGVLIARARTENELKQRAAQLTLLNDVGEKIAAVLDLESVMQRAVQLVQESFAYHHVGLFTVDYQQGKALMQARAGAFDRLFPSDHALEIGQGMVGWVAQHGQTLLANDVQAESNYVNRYPDVIPTCSELSVPIRIGDRIIGVLDAQSPQRGAFSENDVMVLETLADQIAVAMENAHLHASVQAELAERSRAEQELRESEQRLRQVIEQMPYPAEICNPSGTAVMVNQAFLQMFGLPSAELVVGHYNVFDDPLIMQVLGLEEEIRRVYHGDTIFIPELSLPLDQVPEEYASKNTGNLNHEVTMFPVFRPSGEIWRVVTIWKDVTERTQAEVERERLLAQVHEQARQVREIMNTVPEGVVMLDSDGQVLLVNPTAQRDLLDLAGVQVGDNLQQLGNYPLSKLLTSPPKGLWHEIEIQGRAYEVIARPMPYGPEPEHWVMVMRDVTQERQMQRSAQQQERLAAVGQLAAGIAHDFNNMLAVVLLYTDIILDDPELKSDQRERLITIAQQTRNASHLVQQILDFSRRAILERMPMDLLPFIKEQARLLERTLPENINVNLTYQAAGFMVSADPTRLQQAIMNLAINARDAMTRGGDLNISISRQCSEDIITCVTCGQILEGEWVCISIRDTGDGVEKEALPYIFEPFFTTKAPGQGTGLGLSQVYGIIKQHNGHIDVYSEVNQGATFNIYLPALASPRTLPSHPGAGRLIQGQGQTILLVEDEPATQHALEDALTLLGYHVQTANNGQEALHYLTAHANQVDLVMSDVVMPKMGGVALFYALRERSLSLPVVLMSGHPTQETPEKLQDEGLGAWLPKPPNLAQLSEVVYRVLKNTPRR